MMIPKKKKKLKTDTVNFRAYFEQLILKILKYHQNKNEIS